MGLSLIASKEQGGQSKVQRLQCQVIDDIDGIYQFKKV
jgi:hypothetical protein